MQLCSCRHAGSCIAGVPVGIGFVRTEAPLSMVYRAGRPDARAEGEAAATDRSVRLIAHWHSHECGAALRFEVVRSGIGTDVWPAM